MYFCLYSIYISTITTITIKYYDSQSDSLCQFSVLEQLVFLFLIMTITMDTLYTKFFTTVPYTGGTILFCHFIAFLFLKAVADILFITFAILYEDQR